MPVTNLELGLTNLAGLGGTITHNVIIMTTTRACLSFTIRKRFGTPPTLLITTGMALAVEVALRIVTTSIVSSRLDGGCVRDTPIVHTGNCGTKGGAVDKDRVHSMHANISFSQSCSFVRVDHQLISELLEVRVLNRAVNTLLYQLDLRQSVHLLEFDHASRPDNAPSGELDSAVGMSLPNSHNALEICDLRRSECRHHVRPDNSENRSMTDSFKCIT
jgi:hypothetical protein